MQGDAACGGRDVTSLSNNHAAAGLMGGQYQHLGNLHMGWGIGSIDGNVGDVVARQRLDTFIDIGGTLVVTMKAGVAEVGLDKSWFQVGDAEASPIPLVAPVINTVLFIVHQKMYDSKWWCKYTK